MTSKSQKQIFPEIKAKKMLLKHFCRSCPYFLSDFQKSAFYAPSGAEILRGGGGDVLAPLCTTHNNLEVGMDRVTTLSKYFLIQKAHLN